MGFHLRRFLIDLQKKRCTGEQEEESLYTEKLLTRQYKERESLEKIPYGWGLWDPVNKQTIFYF